MENTPLVSKKTGEETIFLKQRNNIIMENIIMEKHSVKNQNHAIMGREGCE